MNMGWMTIIIVNKIMMMGVYVSIIFEEINEKKKKKNKGINYSYDE